MMPRGLAVALMLLTRLPAPNVGEFDAATDLGRAAPHVPLVGLLIGVIVAAVAWTGAFASPWVGALLGLLAWVWVTGALHLDGLGDVADALGAAHRNPERFLAVLADPHAGSFAVVAIALQIAGKLVLLSGLPLAGAGWPLLAALVLVPAWARWGALCWSRWLPSLKPGLGRGFADGATSPVLAAWAGALSAASLWAAPVLLVALPVAGLVRLYWRRRLGGVTGDCLGAGIEVTETALLLALAITLRAGWM